MAVGQSRLAQRTVACHQSFSYLTGDRGALFVTLVIHDALPEGLPTWRIFVCRFEKGRLLETVGPSFALVSVVYQSLFLLL